MVDVSRQAHWQNVKTVENFKINDSVAFTDSGSNLRMLGVVTGFNLSSVGELIVVVSNLYRPGQTHYLHPLNKAVDLVKL